MILISTDAGITWQPSVTNLNENGNDLYSVAFTDDKTGISAGKNGIQVYTHDGGLNWSGKANVNLAGTSSTSKTGTLSQNYPNPFNPVTMINYSIPFDGSVSLKIYDMTGKEVTSLVNGYVNAGTYNAKFDGSNFSSGIYFYILKASNIDQAFSKTMKMILTK